MISNIQIFLINIKYQYFVQAFFKNMLAKDYKKDLHIINNISFRFIKYQSFQRKK